MVFTALHRLLGVQPGPITDAMLDEAVAQRIAEQGDLDWKRELPSQPQPKDFIGAFAKDVAAMANSGGGLIVFGVDETDQRASGRFDVGEVSENLEKALRTIALSAITPPVFNLEILRVPSDSHRALAVVVPTSVEVPHLVFRPKDSDFHFAAPVRDGAFTAWLGERQIEQLYRARFGGLADTTAALMGEFTDASRDHATDDRVWMIGVVRPRIAPTAPTPRSEAQAMAVLWRARQILDEVCVPGRNHPSTPLEWASNGSLRKGLRSWLWRLDGDSSYAWIGRTAIHDDGAVVMAMGAKQDSFDYVSDAGNRASACTQFLAGRLEGFVASLGLLAQANAVGRGAFEADVLVGIDWATGGPLLMAHFDEWEGRQSFVGSEPLSHYEPVRTRWLVGADPDTMRQQIRDLALDAVNQGGVTVLQAIRDAPPTDASIASDVE